jgi:hypothetical protein
MERPARLLVLLPIAVIAMGVGLTGQATGLTAGDSGAERGEAQADPRPHLLIAGDLQSLPGKSGGAAWPSFLVRLHPEWRIRPE